MTTVERVLDSGAGAPASPRPVPLIPTKLGVPLLAPAYRARPRIDAHLDRALADTTRLTLVSAPPGYGKSVAVAGWLAARSVAHTWLSLDPGDNDPARFLRYLVAALEVVRPGLDAGEALAGPDANAGLDFVGAGLIDAIAASDDPFVLVFDDFHVMTAGPVHDLVAFLVAHGPPFAHLVLLTRQDPPFPLARLRAHGRLVELRADELRYTDDEARRHLAEIAGLNLPAEDVTRLFERTEGWIAGVQLAGISLQGRPDAHALIDAFAGTQRFVLDYLAAEVLAGLDDDLRTFLVHISVAERFTEALCRHLSGRADSAALLERAERLNLFLIPLDLDRRWYRFHHLFADYLRTYLDDALLRDLHERAADFFEREGLMGEAIGHALTAGATERAMRLVEEVARATYESGELSTLLSWLDALPRDRVVASPELVYLRAVACFYVGRVEDAARTCDEGEAACADGTTPGPLLTACALIAAFAGRPDALALGIAAVDAVGDDRFIRARALQALATAYLGAGKFELAGETARSALALEAGMRRSTLIVPATTALVTALNLTGHRREAEALCRQCLADHRAEVGHMAGGTPYALYWLGIVLYEANDLAEATEALERSWAAMGTFGYGRALLGMTVSALAMTRQANGLPEGALDAIRTVRRDARAAGLKGLEPGLAELEARLLYMQGDLDAAGRWADTAGCDSCSIDGAAPRWADLARLLTAARVRLAQGRSSEAADLLRHSRAAAEGAGDQASLITVRLLEAALADRTGDRRAALLALEEAIRMAAPEAYVRRVIDDGRPLAHLLPSQRRVAPAFVDEVVAALAGTPGPAARGGAAASEGTRTRQAGPTIWLDGEGQLVETLTDRELEVLGLIARGDSDAAIAAELVVSLATAKWHAAHIRAKLGCKSRTQAILRAQELGLV